MRDLSAREQLARLISQSTRHGFVHVVEAVNMLPRQKTDPTHLARQLVGGVIFPWAEPAEHPDSGDDADASGDEHEHEQVPPPPPPSDHDEDEPEPQGRVQVPHQLWPLDQRKLRGKDTRQSRTFSVPLPDSYPDRTLELVMSLRPKVANKRRGGGCFAASKGMGTIEIKANRPLDARMALSVVVGDGGQPDPAFPPFFHEHNFARDAVFRLGGEFNFEAKVEAGTLTIGFYAELRPEQPTLERFRTEPEDEAVPALPTPMPMMPPFGPAAAAMPLMPAFGPPAMPMPMPIPWDGSMYPFAATPEDLSPNAQVWLPTAGAPPAGGLWMPALVPVWVPVPQQQMMQRQAPAGAPADGPDAYNEEGETYRAGMPPADWQ